ncbi:hypothetical protein Tco_1561088 [Tanacetum coccineum]
MCQRATPASRPGYRMIYEIARSSADADATRGDAPQSFLYCNSCSNALHSAAKLDGAGIARKYGSSRDVEWPRPQAGTMFLRMLRLLEWYLVLGLRDDADDEDEEEDEEEEEEHLASADSAIVVPTDEHVSPPEGTEPTYIGHDYSITIHLLFTITTIKGKRLPSYCRITLPPLPPLPPSLYIPPPVDRRDDIPESEQPPCKRLCLSTLGSRYEIGESSTARPIKYRGVDYGFVSTIDAEVRRQGISKVGYVIRDTWVDPGKGLVTEDKTYGRGRVNY